MIQVYYAKASLMEMEAFHRESRIYLFIIAISTAIALFYQVDTLIGAVGVRTFYGILGLVLAPIFLLLALGLLTWYKAIPIWLSVSLGTLLLFGIAMLNAALVVVGWEIGLLFLYIPPQIVFLGLGVTFALWVGMTKRFSMANLTLLRTSLIVTILFMAAYVLGLGSMPKNSEFDRRGNVSFKDKHYFLDVYWGWLGDPDWLILYECNQYGLFCNEVYRTSYDCWECPDFRKARVELIPEIGKNNLIISVDGSPFYTYQPKQ